jgi:hypothetical protein
MKSIILFSMMCIAGIVNAQQQKDVIYLKNGSIVKGNVVEMDPTENLKIVTADGSIFIFRMDEVEKMVKEPATDPDKAPETQADKADKSKTSGSEVQHQNTMLGPVAIGFQPLGFLQFGPVLNFEFRIAHNFVIGPQFRYTALGLIFNAINDFDNTMVCFGAGVGVKHFPMADKKNKFYYGIAAEYEYGESDDYDDWYGTTAGIVSMVNVGYRFRYNSGFYMNLGLYAGLYNNIYDEWFSYNDNDIHIDSGYTDFFGYVEFGMGFEF